MKIQLMISAVALLAGTTVLAKGNTGADKETLIKKMATACKGELAKEPGLTDTSDGEKVWRNLEDKEHAHLKFSKSCHNAHETYEAKYHKDEEAGEEHEHKE